MTRPQIREGFRRIGVVLGWTLAFVSVVPVTATIRQEFLGSWWTTAKWVAIVFPAAYWCGSRFAYVCGWVLAGFFMRGPEIESPDAFEAAKTEALRQAGGGWALATVVEVRDFLTPYLLYLTWVLAWFAADKADDLLIYLQWGSVSEPSWRLLGARLVAGVGTFAGFFVIFTLVRMLVGDMAVHLLESVGGRLRRE